MWQSLAFRLYVGSMLLTCIVILLGQIVDTVLRTNPPESSAAPEITLVPATMRRTDISPTRIGTEWVDSLPILQVSAYTSSIEQTDDTPCIGSDQSNICERKRRNELICAASREFRLGTKLDIEGLGTCIVADYMPAHRRMSADWYFGQDAEGDDTLYRRARKIGRSDRVVTIVSVPE